jgi:hypothetical protein
MAVKPIVFGSIGRISHLSHDERLPVSRLSYRPSIKWCQRVALTMHTSALEFWDDMDGWKVISRPSKVTVSSERGPGHGTCTCSDLADAAAERIKGVVQRC